MRELVFTHEVGRKGDLGLGRHGSDGGRSDSGRGDGEGSEGSNQGA